MKIRALTLFVLFKMLVACTLSTTSPQVTATQPATQAAVPQPSQTAIETLIPTPMPMITPTATQPSSTQTLSIPSSRMSIISAGYDHTCALTVSGGVKCWGANDYGGLGDGTTIHSSTPVDVVGLSSGVQSVTAGGNQTCALTAAGGVKCWGLNASGELGDGTETNSSTPVDVVGLGSGVVAVSVGGSRACAVTAAGGVKCWGFFWYGLWEKGKKNFNSTPADVLDLGSGVVAVSNGYNHICALTTVGGVKCWGFNASGQLGDGSTKDDSSIWVHVVGLGSRVAAITTGSNHTCALTVSGGVKCWGDNTWGQVGDGTMEDRSTPVDVLGLGSGVVAVAAGSGNTCALTASGGVKCWGHGYLGDGTANNSSTPVGVTCLDSGVAALAVGVGTSVH